MMEPSKTASGESYEDFLFNTIHQQSPSASSSSPLSTSLTVNSFVPPSPRVISSSPLSHPLPLISTRIDLTQEVESRTNSFNLRPIKINGTNSRVRKTIQAFREENEDESIDQNMNSSPPATAAAAAAASTSSHTAAGISTVAQPQPNPLAVASTSSNIVDQLVDIVRAAASGDGASVPSLSISDLALRYVSLHPNVNWNLSTQAIASLVHRYPQRLKFVTDARDSKARVALADIKQDAALSSLPSPPSQTSAPVAYCLLVRNIPGSFHSADLRAFFADMIESNCFKVFQPTHRKDPESSTSQQPTTLKRRYEAIVASTISIPPLSPWKCVVQVHNREQAREMVREYDGKEWISRKGQRMGTPCRVRLLVVPDTIGSTQSREQPIYQVNLANISTQPQSSLTIQSGTIDLTDDCIDLTDPSTDNGVPSDGILPADNPSKVPASPFSHSDDAELVAAARAGEFITPAYLPAGIVGTPTATIHSNIAQLPQSLITRLHLTPIAKIRQFRQFRYNYPNSSTAEDDLSDSSDRQYIELSSDSEQEEWDRDVDTGIRSGQYDSGRGLGKLTDQPLYEDEVHQPWDKGDGSGLVTYTDEQYHDAHRGDFDERTVDMWGIENESPLEDEDGFDCDDDDDGESRRARKAHRHSVVESRLAAADRLMVSERARAAASAQAAAESTATAWTQSPFLQRMMGKMGWRAGEGLGKAKQGIAKPIIPIVRGDKIGLGFASTEADSSTKGPRRKKPKKYKHGPNHVDQSNRSSLISRRNPADLVSAARADFDDNEFEQRISYQQTALPQTRQQRAMGSFTIQHTQPFNVNAGVHIPSDPPNWRYDRSTLQSLRLGI